MLNPMRYWIIGGSEVEPKWVRHPFAAILEPLDAEITARYPGAEINFSPAKKGRPWWFLDVIHAGRYAMLEWDDGVFSISDRSGGGRRDPKVSIEEFYDNLKDGQFERGLCKTDKFDEAKARLFAILHIEIPAWIKEALRFYSEGGHKLVYKNGSQVYVEDPPANWKAREALEDIKWLGRIGRPEPQFCLVVKDPVKYMVWLAEHDPARHKAILKDIAEHPDKHGGQHHL